MTSPRALSFLTQGYDKSGILAKQALDGNYKSPALDFLVPYLLDNDAADFGDIWRVINGLANLAHFQGDSVLSGESVRMFQVSSSGVDAWQLLQTNSRMESYWPDNRS